MKQINNDLKNLFNAIENNDVNEVKRLIEDGADLEARDERKRTALYVACSEGHLEIAKLLIENGADIEAKGYDNQTPLIAASIYNKIEIVKFLIKNGANIEATGFWDETALMLVTRLNKTFKKEYQEIVKILTIAKKLQQITTSTAII